MVYGSLLPVIAGLAIGIALVVVFSIFAFGGSASEKIRRVAIEVGDLKDTYQVGEPISFTVNANGISNNLCNHPKPHIRIVNADDGEETAWASPSTFSTAMGCINPQGFELKWRFGYSGEELPYPSVLDYLPYDNHIVMKKAGLYKMTVEFENLVVEREFQVTRSVIEPSISNEVISLHKGCGLSAVCHARSIFIYGNGAALHREYDRESDRIYIFQIPQNDTAKLFRHFHEADLSMPKTNTFFGTDIVYYEMSFTSNDKTTKVFYLGGRQTPQTILDLDSQIEQLTAKYDDRIIDCTEHSLEDCHIREPVDQTQSNGDDETGLLEPEADVGEPIHNDAEILVDNGTSIEIEYEKD